jgi:hypothetical protein
MFLEEQVKNKKGKETDAIELYELGQGKIKILSKEEYFKLAKEFKEPKKAILNLDKASGPGTHWVAIKTLKDKSLHYYDSLGAMPPFVLKNRIVKYNNIKEQNDKEENCGYRSLLFLL